jgi:hypothetical protein
MENRTAIGREFLADEYLANGKTSTQIARETGHSHKKIASQLSRYGLRKTRSGPRKAAGLTKEVLEREYWVNKKSAQTIGDEHNLCMRTVLERMRAFGIKKRNRNYWDESVCEKRFGRLFVSRDMELRATKGGRLPRRYYRCTCDCGEEKWVLYSRLVKGITKSCGCLEKENLTTIRSNRLDLVGEICASYWHQVQKSAKVRNFEFDVTREFVWDLFLRQGRRCALTGHNLIMPGRTRKKGPRYASLDRIDSKLGYTEANVQWVWLDINRLKNNWGQEGFLEMCRDVVRHMDKNRVL